MPTHRKTDESKNYQLFKQLTRELTDLSSTMEALAWDQETMMPAKGVPFRARQVATLATIHHQKLTDSRLGGLLDELESEALDFWGRAHLREARREYDKAVKLPPALVRDLASTSTLAYQAWVKARQEVDFESFAPWLEKMVDLKRRQARILAGGSRLYDALLDEFEPALTSDEADSIFAVLGPRLSRLRERVETASPLSRDEVLCGHFPRAGQEAFGRTVLTAMGFDWEAGRLDTSPHPFCCGLSPLDVRITTRYSEEDFSASFFGMVHEAGHALYEQGLNSEQFGLPAGTTVSFGIHESQSRLWENFVARSYAFWECWLPRLREVFPAQFDGVSCRTFVQSINRVKASLIRVDADEVTYGLHVILRYEIEKALIEGDLEVSGVEEAWNGKMKEYLGVIPGNAAEGVLQDVHWSQGLMGYFPSYLLGNLYAAQLFQRAGRELPDLEDQIRSGQLLPLREWLCDRVHKKGRTLTAKELIQTVTGEDLNPECFSSYLETKFRDLYGF